MGRKSLKLFAAVVLLGFVLYSYVEVYELVPAIEKGLQNGRFRRVLPMISMKRESNSLHEDLQAPSVTQSRNDWIEDCAIPNTTDYDISRYSSCLRMMDMNEKIKCDTNCQDLIQRYRKENTRRACNDNSNKLISSIWSTDRKGMRKRIKSRGRLHHLFAIENSKIIFCYIPKIGCTVWKRILLTVNGDISSPSAEIDDIHSLFRKKIRSLAKFNHKEALRRLKNYKKFLFVRDPMERMLSLFLDKAVQEGRLPFNESQFEDFLKFIIEQPFQPIQFAEHWAHAFQLCFPCDIQYDFIGRLETSERDTQYIFDNFIQHNRDRLTLHLKTNHSTNSSDFHKKERYFQQLSDDVLRKAADRYHLDYVLFNYSKPYT